MKFEHLHFEARTETFDLDVIIAVAVAALRTQDLVLMEQFAIDVTTVLLAAVEVDN
jgi:hypothetical protein